MPPNCKARRKKELMGPFNGTTGKWVVVMSLLAALFASSTALAGWNEETIETHPTWIYKPDSTLRGSNKRGLMVVLHGCAQTHDQIKDGGNLKEAADNFGLVMAVPYVTKQDGYLADCWDYDKQLDDEHGHMEEIIDLTKELEKRENLEIDLTHVYVVGLSSGGALALKLGCKAPDVFAGIGAIAGPSVGSNQSNATQPSMAIMPTTDDTAVSTCTSLAQGKISSFRTQIANIAYGNMDASLIYHPNATGDSTHLPSCNELRDEDGPKALSDCSPRAKANLLGENLLGDLRDLKDQELRDQHPGQQCVASIKWNDCNIKALQRIYNTGDLGPGTNVQGGKGIERTASADGRTRLSLLVIDNVGHAWPAGTGNPKNIDNGKNADNNQYIAQQGLNYPQYIANWLIENNLRSRNGP